MTRMKGKGETVVPCWSRRFILFSAFFLLVLGAVIIVISTFIYPDLPVEEMNNATNITVGPNESRDYAVGNATVLPSDLIVEDAASESTASEMPRDLNENLAMGVDMDDEEIKDGIHWPIFAAGVVVVSTGLVLLTLYFVCSAAKSRNCPIAPATSNDPVCPAPPPEGPNPVEMTEQEEDEDETANPFLHTKEKGCPRSPVLSGTKDDDDGIPAHLLHYKPRNFNQHGYGTKMAPLATMDEFDHSLRSSMNSLWSQHLHKQDVSSLYDDSELEDAVEGDDAISFHSVVVH